MNSYLTLLQDILDNGTNYGNRTGVDCRGLYGYQMAFDLTAGFPILTTKKVFWRAVVAELLWFLSGDTNKKTLQQQGVHIWDGWGNDDGELGPVYGHQWRAFGEAKPVDQIARALFQLEHTPQSRQIVISAWNPVDIDRMALPPCHMIFHLRVIDGALNLMMFQRSCDAFLGLPFNIASYALLCSIMAHCIGLKPGKLIIALADVHLYENHFDQAREQLKRQPRELPRLSINTGNKYIFKFNTHDFQLVGYNPHDAIKAPIAI